MMTIRVMQKMAYCLLLLLMPLVTAAGTTFVNYKQYAIPMLNDCNPFSAFNSGVPRVFYMNDVGFHPADPDGVTDIPIVMAWHKAGLIKLLGIGSTNTPTADRNLIQDLVNHSVDAAYRVPVYAKAEIPAKLIELANAGGCLHIAIGGTWEQLAVAIEQLQSTPATLQQFIANVSVSGVGSTNIGTTDGESLRRNARGQVSATHQRRFNWYRLVRDTFVLNEKLVRLDRVHFSQSYPNSNSTDLNFTTLNARAERRAIDDWFDAHFLNVSRVGRFIRDYGDANSNFIERNDTSGIRFLLCNNRGPNKVDANGNVLQVNTACPESRWGDRNGKGMKMRIADFNAIAYLIWGVDQSVVAFSSSMRQKLQTAWALLRR